MDPKEKLQRYIETALDDKARHLAEDGTGAIVSSLRKAVLTQIQAIGDEDGSCELDLTADDVRQIYEDLIKSPARKEILEEYGIIDSTGFRSLLGKRAQDLLITLERITLFGKVFHLHFPFGLNKKYIHLMKKTLSQISKRKDLAPFFSENMILEMDSTSHVTFVVEKDGNKVKYIVTPEDVLMVVNQPSDEEIMAARKLNKAKHMADAMDELLRSRSKSWNTDQKSKLKIFEPLYPDADSADSAENIDRQFATDLDIFPVDERGLLQKLRDANKVIFEAFLDGNPHRKGKLTLIDDNPDLPETERVQHTEILNYSNGYFERRYFGKNGKVARIARYTCYEKINETVMDGEKIVCTKIFREDGTVKSVHYDESYSEHFDDKGEIIYEIRTANPGGLPKCAIINKLGEKLTDFATFLQEKGIEIPEKIINPSQYLLDYCLTFDIDYFACDMRSKISLLSGRERDEIGEGFLPAFENATNEYYEKAIRVLNTPDRYLAFEELFLRPLLSSGMAPGLLSPIAAGPDNDVIRKIRKHGIKLLGLDKDIRGITDSIRAQYGIEVEIPDWHEIFAGNYVAGPLQLKELLLALKKLEQMIKKYPKRFIQNAGVKKIYLIAGTVKNGDSSDPGCAGFSTGSSIVTSQEDDVFHHELLHSADYADGGFRLGDDEWSKAAHGDNFASVYVYSSGHEARQKGFPDDRPSGFARAYGKYGGIDEDQATVAEIMWTNYAQIMAWAEREPELAAKVRMTKQFYFRMSNGRMDAKFWEDHSKGVQFDDEYWRLREEAQDFGKEM